MAYAMYLLSLSAFLSAIPGVAMTDIASFNAIKAHQPDRSGDTCTQFGLEAPLKFVATEDLGSPITVSSTCPSAIQQQASGLPFGAAGCRTLKFISAELESGGFQHVTSTPLFPDLSDVEQLTGSNFVQFYMYFPSVEALSPLIDVSLLVRNGTGATDWFELAPVTVIRADVWQPLAFYWGDARWRRHEKRCLYKSDGFLIFTDASRKEGRCMTARTCAQRGVAQSTDIYGCATGEVCCTDLRTVPFASATPAQPQAAISAIALQIVSRDRSGRHVDSVYLGGAYKCQDACNGACSVAAGLACDRSGACLCANSPPWTLGPDQRCHLATAQPCALCPADVSYAAHVRELAALDERTQCAATPTGGYACDCRPGYYRVADTTRVLRFACLPLVCSPTCHQERAECRRVGERAVCQCKLGLADATGSPDGSKCAQANSCAQCDVGELCNASTGLCECNGEDGWVRDEAPNAPHACRKRCEPACDPERQRCEAVATADGGAAAICVCLDGFEPLADPAGGAPFCEKPCAVACQAPAEVCADGECVCNSLEKYFSNTATGECELHESYAAANAAALREQQRLAAEAADMAACAGVECASPLLEKCDSNTQQCECRSSHPIRNAAGVCESPCDQCGQNTECRFFRCFCKDGYEQLANSRDCTPSDRLVAMPTKFPQPLPTLGAPAGDVNALGLTSGEELAVYISTGVAVCCVVICCFVAGGWFVLKLTSPQDMLKYENPMQRTLRQERAVLQRQATVQSTLNSSKADF